MSRKEIYEQKTESFIQPIVDKYHFELVDVEYVKEGSDWYLRAYIDKEGGIEERKGLCPFYGKRSRDTSVSCHRP